MKFPLTPNQWVGPTRSQAVRLIMPASLIPLLYHNSQAKARAFSHMVPVDLFTRAEFHRKAKAVGNLHSVNSRKHGNYTLYLLF